MAQLTLTFDAWRDGQVGPATMEIPVVAGPPRPKAEPVSNRLLREFVHPNAESTMCGLKFSPDGQRLIAGDYPGGVVIVWDVATGKTLTAIETGNESRGSMNYMFVSPDWQSMFVAHGGPRDHERIERDGKKLYRWSFSGEIRAWDLNTGKLTRKYRHQPPRFIQHVEHSPDGSRFFSIDWLPGEHEGRATAITLWNAATGQYRELWSGTHAHGQFSSEGKFVALVSSNEKGMSESLSLFDSNSGQQIWWTPVAANRTQFGIVGFSPDGRYLLADRWTFASDAKFDEWQSTLKWFDMTTGRESYAIEGEPNGQFHGCRFSRDGRNMIVGNMSGDVTRLDVYDVETRKLKKFIVLNRRDKGSRVTGSLPTYSADGKWIAFACRSFPITRPNEGSYVLDGDQPRIYLIDAKSCELRETIIAPPSFTISLGFSPDGRYLASGGNGKVQLWDLGGLTSSEPRTK